MTQTKKFAKVVENFTCERCGYFVVGSGYTNHCPECLWSKHVDIHPGDRAESCQGLMEPVAVERKGDQYLIHHRCTLCGFERPNFAEEIDNSAELARISAQPFQEE